MSKSVEDRVVKMTFDNAAFEKGVAETLKSLDKLQKALNFKAIAASMPQTVQSVNNLKQALKFEEAEKSIKGVSSATEAPKGEFDKLSGSVQGVSKSFIAMSAIAVTAIATLTNTAVQAGTRIAHSFFGVITDGFHEFETNMTSIQTILANTSSKGTNLKEVNAALDEMNAFSDKTIFNFSEMARNMGTFTAAGVDLKTSASAIKGIANLAALSGSTSEQASVAMYQLSQAIASGTVKLIDWNSVVNAGMGGEVFQKALFNTAKAMGQLKDVDLGTTFADWTKKQGSFRESLQEGWLTSEVLTNTLSQFTGDLTDAQLKQMGFTKAQAAEIQKLSQIALGAATQVKTFTQLISTVKESIGSGWATTFRLIIGDFDESRVLFTLINSEIGKFVQKTADARNTLLTQWRDMGGRVVLLDALHHVLVSFQTLLRPIADAFREIFPKKTAKDLFDLTFLFRKFIYTIFIIPSTEKQVKRAFAGIFAAISIGLTILKEFSNFLLNIGRLLVGRTGLGVGFRELVAKVGDFVVKMQQILVKGKGIHNFFAALTDAMNRPINAIGALKDAFLRLLDRIPFEKLLTPLDALKDKILAAFGNLPEIINKVSDVLNNLRLLFIDMFNHIPFEKVTAQIDKFKNAISNVFGGISKDSGVQKASDDITHLKDITGDLFKNISMTTNLDQLKVNLVSFKTSISEVFNPKETVDWRDKVLTSLGLVNTGLSDGTSAIDHFKDAFSKVGDTFDVNLQLSKKFNKAFGAFKDIFKGPTEASANFNDIWASVAEQIDSVNQSADDTPGALAKIGNAIKGFFGGVFDALKALFTTENWDRLIKTMEVGLGLSIARVFKNLTDDKEKIKFLDKLLAPFKSFMKGLQDAVKTWERGKQIEALRDLAVAIAILAVALVVLSLIDPKKLTVALGAITSGLIAMVLVMKSMNKSFGGGSKKDGIQGLIGGAQDAVSVESMAASLILVAAAMLVLAFAFEKFGKMDPKVLIQGGEAIAGALASLIFMMHALPDNKDMLGFGIALIGISVALLILFGSIMKYGEAVGGKKSDQFIAGTLAVASVIAILGLAMHAFPQEGEVLKMAAALVVMSVAIIIIAKSIAMVGKMKIGNIIAAALSLISLVVALTTAIIIMDKAKISMDTIGQFAAMAGSLLLIAAAVKIIGDMSLGDIAQGAGVLLGFIAVFAGLVIAITATGDIAIPAISALATAFLQFGGAVALFGLGVLLAAHGIKVLSSIDKKGLQRLKDVLIAIGEAIPLLMAGIVKGFIDGAKEIVKAVPDFLDELGTSLDAFIEFARTYVPRFIELALDMVNGFMQKVRDHAREFATLGAEIISEFFGGLTEKNAITDKSPLDEVIDTLSAFLVQIFEGIKRNAGPIIDAFNGMLIALFDAIARGADPVIESFAKMMASIITGLGKYVSILVDAWFGVLVNMIEATAIGISRLGESLLHLVNAISQAIIDLGYILISTGISLAITLLNGLAQGVLTLTESIALIIENFLTGAARIVKEHGQKITDKFKELGEAIAEGIGEGIRATNPASFIGAFIDGLLGKGEDHAKANSPAKLFMPLGASIAQGVAVGMSKDDSIDSTIVNMTDAMVTGFQGTLTRLSSEFDTMDEFQPTITPVLDLTEINKDAQGISSIFGTNPMSVDLSSKQAASIASNIANGSSQVVSTETSTPTEVSFQQNIYAPDRLSTADLYRQTKGQFILAKERLKI